MSPRKNIIPKSLKPNSSKAPGKTVLPRNKFRQKSTHHRNNITQRRFSLIDSDSSELSGVDESDDDGDDDNDDDDDDDEEELARSGMYGNKFTAIESSSDDESETESSNEEIWKSNSKKVVNTSSEDEDDEDDDSSSSDDEDVDFVKLTAERKARSLEFRSVSPFKSPTKELSPAYDVDFSFDFNNNDHQLKIANEEEDLGEAIEDNISPLKADAHPISGEPLGFMDIEDSSESDNDINKDELLRAIEQDSDGLDTGIETGDEEYNLLKQEADNIAQEYDQDGIKLNSSANVTPRNSIVEEMIKKHKKEMNNEDTLQFVSDDEYDSEDYYDDDDDDDDNYDEFTIPFFDDGFLKSQEANQIVKQKEDELDSDDDSYLWDYFFSSGDEDEDEGQNQNQSNNNFSEDESTDEDETLPPPSSRKKIGSKAQELLSSSSVTARPPALGTWSTDSKPFGIIDGLSTRSLLPPMKNSSSTANSTSVSMIPMTPTTNNNHVDELALDELLNISELEDDEDANREWLEVTASDRKVPLSAFRNKGVINEDHSHINATRRFSISRDNNSPSSNMKKASKKKQRFNEITMTPIRVMTKSSKSNKKKSSKRRRQSMAEAAVEGLRVTRSGLFSEDTLTNVEEFLSGLGNDAELSILFREVQ